MPSFFARPLEFSQEFSEQFSEAVFGSEFGFEWIRVVAMTGHQPAHREAHSAGHVAHVAAHKPGEKLEHKYAPKPAAPAPAISNTADEVVKLLAVVCLILMLMGKISIIDTAILLGLGFAWFSRTATLGGKKKSV